MRLATYAPHEATEPRIGIVIAGSNGDMLAEAHTARALAEQAGLAGVSGQHVPADMLAVLEDGDALSLLRDLERYMVASLARDDAAAAAIRSACVAAADAVFYPPIRRPGKIIMVGGNYGKHNAEARGPNVPAVLLEERTGIPAFAKFASVQLGHGHSLAYPRQTAQLDYEAELAVVIGKRCKDVRASDAAGVIAGFTIVNDISMRDIQFPEMKRGSTMLGKNLDGAMPVGPYLVLAEEVPDPQALRVTCHVNGELRQNDTTADMVHSVADLIAHFSAMTLEPGDIISTGTPGGVGIFWNPPEHGLLHVGDTVEIAIEHLGTLRNTVVAEPTTEAQHAS